MISHHYVHSTLPSPHEGQRLSLHCTLLEARAEYQFTALHNVMPIHKELNSGTATQHKLMRISHFSTQTCIHQLSNLDSTNTKYFIQLAEQSFDVVKKAQAHLAQLELGQARLLIALAKNDLI